MSYPTAYRSGAVSKGYAGAGVQSGSHLAFLAPLAAQASKQVSASATARALGGIAGRVVGRAIPVFGALLLAYELYELWQAGEDGVPSEPDWSQGTWLCGGPGDYFAPFTNGCGSSWGTPPAQMNKIFRYSTGFPGEYGEDCVHGNEPYLSSGQYWPKVPPGCVGRWHRVVTGAGTLPKGAVDPPMTEEVPAKQPVFDAPARPLVPPMVDPFSQPINKPVPQYKPLPYWVLPYRVPNPWRSPTEQTQRGPATERGFADPWMDVSAPTVEVDTEGDVRITPPDHRLRPPGPREKEKKLRVSTGGHPVRFVFDTLTEVDDAIDALWDALPKHCQSKVSQVPKAKRYYGVRYQRPKMQQKLRDLYKCFHEIDWNEAIDNLVENEIKDRVFGKIGRAAGQAGGALGKPVGAGLGPVF